MKRMDPSELFDCRMCGDCCQGYGGTFVNARDITVISEFIGVHPDTFLQVYCRMSGKKPVLAQRDDGYCIFWDEKCRIHPVKPRMCRAWPFIEGVLRDVSNWYTMAEYCPGMRINVSDEEIVACVKQECHRMESF